MKSLSSRLFKAGFVNPSTEKKVIEPKPLPVFSHEEDDETLAETEEMIQVPKEVQQMLDRAKIEANQILEQARNQATEIINNAELEHQQMLEEIQQQASQLYESSSNEGFQEGYNKGFEEGEIEAQNAYMQVIAEANDILQMSIEHKKEELLAAQDLIIELAYEIACKVILKNPEMLKDQIIELVLKSLEKVRDTEKIELCINPSDFAKVHDALPIFKNILAGKSEVVILNEAHIEPGSCMLHTKMGTIDAKITTQFEEIKKALQTINLGSDSLA